mmetsp:Transcript_41784/g.100304  ORF Transcript_41784/g.100304 Transcript_41784/m.100304 type:complete len:200 (+) Transcript_41784:979-1578(+)
MGQRTHDLEQCSERDLPVEIVRREQHEGKQKMNQRIASRPECKTLRVDHILPPHAANLLELIVESRAFSTLRRIHSHRLRMISDSHKLESEISFYTLSSKIDSHQIASHKMRDDCAKQRICKRQVHQPSRAIDHAESVVRGQQPQHWNKNDQIPDRVEKIVCDVDCCQHEHIQILLNPLIGVVHCFKVSIQLHHIVGML